MKLVAFRIQNFRSIIDTGWQQLAHDNITSLIGQNESGKTSILEAIKAFHDGTLIEDMLRSDLSLPEVTCRFRFHPEEIENHVDMKRVDPRIRKVLSSLETLSITRKWEDDMDSFMVMGEELQEIFDEEADQLNKREQKVYDQLAKLTVEVSEANLAVSKGEQDLDKTELKIEEIKHRINELKRNTRKLSPRQNKLDVKNEMALEEEMLKKMTESLKQKETSLQEKREILEALSEKKEVRDKLEEVASQIQEKRNNLSSTIENLKQIHQLIGMYPSEKELRAAEIKEEVYRSDIEKFKQEITQLQKKHDSLMLTMEKVFENVSAEKAAREAEKELLRRAQFYSSGSLAEELFKCTPDFEMFEDFSSLLPNRIDLEDVIKGNTKAEGYKAALNFLTITGLDYSFFQQPSNRILKQKIENLNGELSLNFQEFWRQNVGKNNKIKINFELAHYDHTNPEKSGKPFIEFWIKDDKERLYPKQRSRGVRWFLSFFLELKATAMDKSRRKKVLLIDEPGVSLHARAQEDVLMVFDDIKEQMQIIYTTHSPHLIDVNKLYRILAVQRAVEDDMNSETVVYNARSLKSATADTLSPIYSMMGARLSQQEIIKAYNNVIVKDIASYYFLKAIMELTGFEKECYYLPASGPESIAMMVNILIGWGLEYLVLNFGNSEERMIHEKLRKTLFDNKIDLANKQLMLIEDYMDVEDLFSTIDFKKYVVQVREGITVMNSDYLKDNNYSRAVLASNFLQDVKNGKISFKKLDEETRENLNRFNQQLTTILQ